MTSIKQSDFSATHKLTPPEVKSLRDKYLKEGEDWFSGGPTNRTIFWTEEAAKRIEVILSHETHIPQSMPSNEPETLEIRITKMARNPKFVYGDFDGNRIAVFSGKHSNRIVGKKVRVVTSIIDGETRYTYQP